ncbi:Uncharacterised protein [Chlamydia abortus]|nr:Uncharacterised protein [Chlamydia abortus]
MKHTGNGVFHGVLLRAKTFLCFFMIHLDLWACCKEVESIKEGGAMNANN